MKYRMLIAGTCLLLASLLVVNCDTGLSQEEYDKVTAELRDTLEQLRYLQGQPDAAQDEAQMQKDDLAELQEELGFYEELGITVYSNVQPKYSKSSTNGPQVKLEDNPVATNPTWEQLKTFLLQDKADEQPYRDPGYICGDYAEQVHNNAEAAGIRTAWVAIDFEGDSVGHALNAFITSDKGLIYVDSTGKGLETISVEQEPNEQHQPTAWDKIAYIEIGKEYGIIGLSDGAPLSYAGYESMALAWDSYNRRMEAYNVEVKQFNSEIEGKVFYKGTAAWKRIRDWSDGLEEESEVLVRERKQLEIVWEPLGIVSSVEIYW